MLAFVIAKAFPFSGMKILQAAFCQLIHFLQAEQQE